MSQLRFKKSTELIKHSMSVNFEKYAFIQLMWLIFIILMSTLLSSLEPRVLNKSNLKHHNVMSQIKSQETRVFYNQNIKTWLINQI